MLITPAGEKAKWMPIAADVVPLSAIDHVGFDVLIVSDPDTFEPFLATDARLKINYHLSARMLYRKSKDRLQTYYGTNEGILHIANSKWTAEQAEQFRNIKVEKIIPGGIDRNIFRPVNSKIVSDVICYNSRGGDQEPITIVNAARGLRVSQLTDAGASQYDLAVHICSARVFVSACLHEGFNFRPLEAMACGVPVAMTDDGGARDYARNGENALIVEPGDQKGLSKAIRRLIKDVPLRLKLIENGMETAWCYNWEKVSADLADLIADHT
jgi:glycosyltransferase involved in cell wall biosynthesis